MRVRKFGTLLATGVAAALVTLTFSTAPLAAQEAVIKGKITSETGEPLGGANVVVASTNLGAITAANGTYTLTIGANATRGQQVVLTARYIGHKPVTRTVTLSAGEQEQNFQLASDPLRLDEVVVTGVAEATDRRKLPMTVASVNSDQLQAVPGASALQAVEGKVAGVRLVPNSAQPGAEPSLRLRGATSIGGRQDPLVIVDGVITRYGLADIAGEDVERVEIVKGAAASALYGSDAANGVVQVFTKRGASLPEGGVRITTRVEGGANNMPSRLEFSHHHAFEINSTANYCVTKDTSWTVSAVGNYCVRKSTGKRIVKLDQIANNPFSVYYDHWDALVNAGAFWTGYASVGQRSGGTNYSASFEETRNKGVIFGLGGYNRQNFRLNVDQQMRSNLDASVGAFYGRSTNGRAAEGSTGPFFGLMFLQPDVNIQACCNKDGTPYLAAVPLSGDVANDFNPLYELNTRKIDQDRNRFTGSGRLRWRMNQWLQAEGTFGYDQESQEYTDLTPFGHLSSSGSSDKGSLYQQSKNDWQANGGVTLTSVRHFGQITNTTKIAAIFEDQRDRYLQSTAGGFLVPRVPEFGTGTDALVPSLSYDARIRNENFYGVTTFDIRDRYIVDGLVRRDGSSLFGPNNRWATYYRVSGAWRLTQDINLPAIEEMRLRASYGTAGLRPQFNYQYEILSVVGGNFKAITQGNPDLKPARSAELEVGTNIDFKGGRYSLEYTYAQKTTKDQIILVDLPAVAWFANQWQNVGSLRARTHEVTFAARVINQPGTQLTLNIVGDRTRQVITDWPLPEKLYRFEQMPAAFFLGKNSDLGVLYGNHWIRNVSELYDDPAKAALKGPGQAWSPDSVMVNEDGYVVRKSVYGTPNERAIKYVYCKVPGSGGTCAVTSNIVRIGNANPDFNLSFGLNFNISHFSVNALLDWSHGGQLYNGTRQWAFQATRDRVQDQAAKPTNAATCGVVSDPMPACPQKALPYYGVGFYNGLDPNDFFVESGSFAKLKEFAIHYTFAGSTLRSIGLRNLGELRVGIIGRNLFTITKYSGLDPEVSGLFGDPFQVRMDWFQYPQFRTLSAVVEITY